LLFLYVDNDRTRLLLDNCIIRKIALLSYGIYISNWIIIRLVEQLLPEISAVNALANFVLVLSLTLVISTTPNFLVGKPFLRLKYRFK